MIQRGQHNRENGCAGFCYLDVSLKNGLPVNNLCSHGKWCCCLDGLYGGHLVSPWSLKMRWNADRTGQVGANVKRRHACRCCTATGTTGCALDVPRIISATKNGIVGLIIG